MVKLERFGLFLALLGPISTGSSISSSWLPQTLPFVPLSATLYHILAVSLLLSRRNLKVRHSRVASPGKARGLVVNQSSDHKELGLRI